MKPFFVSIPHSGETVPPEASWLKNLPEPILMCDVDRFVDELYEPGIRALNLPVIVTQWHRYVIDLNRLPDDVDQDSVVGSTRSPSPDFASGLHWTKTTRGDRLLPQPITMELHQQLVKKYYHPFHAQVRAQYLSFFNNGAKKVYHLDAHSMPSVGTSAHRDPGQTRAAIVVSDCEGKSCETWFKDLVIKAYETAGFEVAYNWPYRGGRVTETYGLPQKGQHAIQVEMSRILYMDEETKKLRADLAPSVQEKVKKALQTIYNEIA